MENEEKLLVNSALNASSFAIQHLVTKEYEKTEMHFHDCYECMLVHGGEAIFQIEGGSVTLLQNSLVLLEPNRLHRPIFRNLQCPYQRYTLHINGTLLSSISTPENRLADVFSLSRKIAYGVLAESNAEELIAMFEKALLRINSNEEFGKDILIRSALSELLVFICRNFIKMGGQDAVIKHSYSRRTLDALAFIEENLPKKISLDIIAQHLHVDKSHLAHIFKQETGISPYQYIIQKRIIYSQKLLHDGESPSDVCTLCGFNDYSSFYRAFFNELGVSPREYQRRVT